MVRKLWWESVVGEKIRRNGNVEFGSLVLESLEGVEVANSLVSKEGNAR